ncbi:unnamed protein product [Fusarium equiseti]|uniref:DUF7136 domain-containing protein n=1 Tax=Fusarium equiseti TaxID=61235 RepID=A0A8J2J2E9_FUSEQ|nr:unnamed protein product [Fusarium equiseti]
MRLSPLYYASLACWFITLWKGVAGERSMNSSALEVDLAFPRNETYNPSPVFPIVISIGNPGMIPIFEPLLSYQVYNYGEYTNPIINETIALPSVNESTGDPYIEFTAYEHPFNTEGKWSILVTLDYAYCVLQPTKGSREEIMTLKRDLAVVTLVDFTTKGPLKQVDLGAATKHQICPLPAGLTINATGTTTAPKDADFQGDTCAFRDLPLESGGHSFIAPPNDEDRCAVTLEPAAVSSIDASMTSSHGDSHKDDPKGVDRGSSKESQESAGFRIAAGGVTCLAFVLGVITYIDTLI